MLSGSVCAGVGSALPAASPARRPRGARGWDRRPAAGPKGWGFPRVPLVPRPGASGRRIPPLLGLGLTLLLPPHWPVAEPALRTRVPGTPARPTPAARPHQSPPRSERPTAISGSSPPVRATKASSGQSLSPRALGACCLPWGGLPRAGGRLKARPPLHSRVPQRGCSQGTHAGGGRKPPAAPPSVQVLAARAQLPAPSAVPSACISPRGWQARRDLPNPMALTSLLSSSSSSRERPPASVPAGPTTRRGTGSRRRESAARLPGLDRARGRRGCRRSRRAAAERAAAGTVYKLPALAGPRAARPHTPERVRDAPRGLTLPRRGSVRNFFQHLPA